MSENKEKRPFGFKDKIGYMFGDFGNDFSFLFAIGNHNYCFGFHDLGNSKRNPLCQREILTAKILPLHRLCCGAQRRPMGTQ